MEIEYSNFAIDSNIYGYNELCGLVDINSKFIYNNFYDVKKLTYKENISVKKFLYGIIKFPHKKIIDSLLNELEIDDIFLKKKMNHLSTGELIKILTIKLLLDDSKVIFLKNIDAYLNNKDLSQLLKIIKRQLKNTNKNVIFVTNNVDNIIADCERYVVVENNQIIYNGSDIKSLPLKSELTTFVELANKKNANLENYKDINDLLKAIYRSVKK